MEQIALISMENKKMEIPHKLFTSWLADLTLIGSEDVIKETLKKNMQKFHSLFCKALGLVQGIFQACSPPGSCWPPPPSSGSTTASSS